jgi:transmembrane sensor
MNIQIYEQASEWVVKHREGGLDLQERKSFDAWLRESPQHVRSYLEMSSVWEDVPSLDPGWNPSADELIARARADDNVVSLSAPSHSAESAPSRQESGEDRIAALERPARADLDLTTPLSVRPASAQSPVRTTGEEAAGRARGGMRLSYALAASLLIAIVGGWFYSQRGVYATDVGEQRSLALADGSTVELNSRSRIKVQYTEHERRVDLLEGQALFHVAKHKSRPFIVQTGNTRVRAVGTAFDVYKTSSGTVVTVVEGRVAVHTRLSSERLANESGHEGGGSSVTLGTSDAGNAEGSASTVIVTTREHSTNSALASPNNKVPSGSPIEQPHTGVSGDVTPPETSGIRAGAGEILLAAGEQVVVTPAAVTAPKQANVAAATAWTQRSLVFDSSPLTEVAQEFNRYNTRRLVIEDPQLAHFHISGVFSSVEPTLLLRFLGTQPELVVEETDTEIRISKK